MRFVATAALLLLSLAGVANAQRRMAPPQDIAAHDVNGVATGMTIPEATSILRAPVAKHQANGFLIRVSDGEYQLRTDAGGRIYQIDYDQPLGDFDAQNGLVSSVTEKMSAKYGPPQSRSGVGANWNSADYTQQIKMSVGGSPVSLHIEIEDRRVQQGDSRRLNAGPNANAAKAVHF